MTQDPPDLPDYSTRKYVKHLVAKIRQYWHSRGYLNVWVEPVEINLSGNRYFGVRSNLVNGLPPSVSGRTRRRLNLEPRIGSASNFESFGTATPPVRNGAAA